MHYWTKSIKSDKLRNLKQKEKTNWKMKNIFVSIYRHILNWYLNCKPRVLLKYNIWIKFEICSPCINKKCLCFIWKFIFIFFILFFSFLFFYVVFDFDSNNFRTKCFNRYTYHIVRLWSFLSFLSELRKHINVEFHIIGIKQFGML